MMQKARVISLASHPKFSLNSYKRQMLTVEEQKLRGVHKITPQEVLSLLLDTDFNCLCNELEETSEKLPQVFLVK